MDTERKKDLDDKWKQVAIKAVTDETFKGKLASDPLVVLKDNGIILPQEVEVKIGTGNIIKFQVPPEHKEALDEELKWWNWRLDIIREFGRDEKPESTVEIAPETEEGV